MKIAVEVRNLKYEYWPQKMSNPLDINNLTVLEGETLVMFGPSGAGKTTTLRLIAGLLTAKSGSITVGGQDVTNLPPHLRNIGMVFQDPLLFPFNSVIDNVGFAARIRGESRPNARRSALEFLELVGLVDLAQRDVRTLSGGQTQRVSLARSLAARPILLLLDEPFSALDLDMRSEMQELLIRLREHLRLTMILVTHDQREAAILADIVVLISKGKVLQKGKFEELYTQPINHDVHRMMGGKNEVTGITREGYFHSDLGIMPLPSGDNKDGPAVLLVRQESVQVVSARSAVRPDGSFLGRVVENRLIGARTEIIAKVHDTFISAEVAHSQAPRVGDEVLLQIPLDSRWTVSLPSATNHHANSNQFYSQVRGAI
jgi:putative spermidine/putrescine transport system ATP-binding protein